MDNNTKLALAVAVGKDAKKVRKTLVPGTYPIDEKITLHVQGAMSVGEDEEYTPVGEIPMKAALALFIRYSGITGDRAIDALERAMTRAIEQDEDSEECIAEEAMIAEAEAKLEKMLKNLPKKRRKGKVKVVVVVEEMQQPALQG